MPSIVSTPLRGRMLMFFSSTPGMSAHSHNALLGLVDVDVRLISTARAGRFLAIDFLLVSYRDLLIHHFRFSFPESANAQAA